MLSSCSRIILAWPWNVGYVSLSVIGNGTTRSITYKFLFVFHCNYGHVLYRFRNKARYSSKNSNFSYPLLFKFKMADGRHIENRFCRAMLCIARIYAVARCLSVCSSVTRQYSVETGQRVIKLLRHRLRHSSLCDTKRYDNIPIWKKSRFSTNISIHPRNNTRYGHSYYEMRIGNPTQAFEWYYFQRPWVTWMTLWNI